MRQVPVYTIIGDGRMAKHFCHYLDLLHIPYLQWSRRKDPKGAKLNSNYITTQRVILLISDSAIESFIQEHDFLRQKLCVHFSGALATELAASAHPLMTFGPELYDEATYLKIPFILEEGHSDLCSLLPGLPNVSYNIPVQLKPLYHSLCVLSGNFTCILWHKFFTELETAFNIPKHAVVPYLEQITHNIISDSLSALTGPLIRNDQKTIQANLQALGNDSFAEVYQAFVTAYQTQLSSVNQ